MNLLERLKKRDKPTPLTTKCLMALASAVITGGVGVIFLMDPKSVPSHLKDYGLTIYEKNIGGADSFVPYGAGWFLVVLSGLAIASVIKNRTLQKQVAERTRHLENEMQVRQTISSCLETAEAQLTQMIDLAGEGVVITSLSGQIRTINSAMCSIIGERQEAVIGRKLRSFCHDNIDMSLMDLLTTESQDKPATQLREQITLRHKDGTPRYVRITSLLLRNHQKEPTGKFLFVADQTELKRQNNELSYLVNHDQITGLPNRYNLFDQIGTLIKAGQEFGLILFDLDDFKYYNDINGHPFGDEILRAIANKLVTRKAPSDIAARLGGDEFVVLVLGDRADVAARGMQCVQSMDTSLHVDNQDVTIKYSIGVAIHPGDGTNAEELIKNADLAMYQSKSRGKGRMTFFSMDMAKRLQRKIEMSNELAKAIEREEFEIHYQPQICAVTGQVSGMEALLRWRPKNQDRIVPPDEFIPILEETGLIVPVGEWVLESACRMALAWQWPGTPLRLSVNLSPRQFIEPGLPDAIMRILQETGFDPSSLCLEITESLLIDNFASTTKKIKGLTSAGITFSIDDFGTGYSSMGYLQKLPIREIKIDRSFVSDIPDNKSNMVIIKTILAMAQALEVEVVAEGVETLMQAEILTTAGVHHLQGFLFARPLHPQHIQRFLDRDPWPDKGCCVPEDMPEHNEKEVEKIAQFTC